MQKQHDRIHAAWFRKATVQNPKNRNGLGVLYHTVMRYFIADLYMIPFSNLIEGRKYQ